MQVDEHLCIKGLENVFAIGDVALVDEARTAITAGYHAAHVAKAIKAIHANKLVPVYKPGPDMMLVPFGECVQGYIFTTYKVARFSKLLASHENISSSSVLCHR